MTPRSQASRAAQASNLVEVRHSLAALQLLCKLSVGSWDLESQADMGSPHPNLLLEVLQISHLLEALADSRTEFSPGQESLCHAAKVIYPPKRIASMRLHDAGSACLQTLQPQL